MSKYHFNQKSLKMIPWGQIISASVTMADLAHSLYKKTKKDPKTSDPNDADALLGRIEKLEAIQLEQSNLLQQMTQQNKILIKKVRNAYIMTTIALLLAAGSIVSNLFLNQ